MQVWISAYRQAITPGVFTFVHQLIDAIYYCFSCVFFGDKSRAKRNSHTQRDLLIIKSWLGNQKMQFIRHNFKVFAIDIVKQNKEFFAALAPDCIVSGDGLKVGI